MDDFLRLPEDRRRLVCEQGQARLGLSPVSLEKDFWVCWTLRELFGLPVWGPRLTFKGGTSLSKCWQLIARFSEDIDVVIDRQSLGFGGESLGSKRMKKLLEACSQAVQEELRPALEERLRTSLPPGLGWELVMASEAEDRDQQTLLFRYPSAFQGGLGYVRPLVKIELGARSETEPVETPTVTPYLAEAFPELLPDSGFSLRAVSPLRTFWEKAMLLHEERFRPPDKPRKTGLSRHYYDLWCLIGKGIAARAAADTGLFERVALHRQRFFKLSWVDYGTLEKGTLKLLPQPEQLALWRRDYQAMRAEMFFGPAPDFETVLGVVQEFEEGFNRTEG
ncbi:MAG TPA: nucleotidyl transferase AbiEii/AbiGii toxin family protein [Myxococcota bacterium]|nr:nucleotidyl transferase AbiEii/AbiGii toxin family protein [Myxococcota bacterium]HRY96948.1 nucleotidyl transferase AbiEii/AbiGii toxin family protein [Myxococcota bacterium]